MRVGIEVGGTFTDLVVFDGDEVRVAKVPSTPEHPDIGAIASLDAGAVDLASVEDLVHGSTVATNAVLEHKFDGLALLVTRGLRDVLHIQRHTRRRIYDLGYRKPEPVVARRDTFEVPERLGPDGGVIEALDEARVRQLIEDALIPGDYQAIAICLLNSYADPSHEQRVAALVRERLPDTRITCSSDVCREFREYERCSTTVLAAYVQPVIDAYLSRFVSALEARGYAGRVSVMQSNGGRLPARAMSSNAITSLFSGPAAGVTGATRQAARSGCTNLITLDMGGTSTDVCLVENGRPGLTAETDVDGLPVKTPVIDIATIGAGGGSIIWVDDGGLLRVGPRSAGAAPGPACYGRGGSLPTITDAHVVRGTIRPESFLGGHMQLDADASARAIEPIAQALGVDALTAADSAIRVAESNIVRAIQRISTERGKDPRDYVLVPFGGAGPMQAARVADELGVATVLVPPHAGVLSAYGLLASDYVHYESRTRKLTVNEENLPLIRETLGDLRRRVIDYLASIGLRDLPELGFVLEMRYVSQAFEISVELAESDLGTLDADALRTRFEQTHRRVFEFDEGGRKACEIVSFRAGGSVRPASVPALTLSSTASSEAVESGTIFEQGRSLPCQCLGRDALPRAPAAIRGAAPIEDGTSTIYLPPDWQASQDAASNLILTRGGR
ncbi:MAG: hydantoinase/oxoprolinase family protein [Gammaproteobacteria bacterium]|nr:hydantoinase/oxoprolinase family protein [Gammaproteobacteria bacterium]